MTRVFLLLGGNLGDVPETMIAALHRLESVACSVVATSPVYESLPMGSEAGQSYLNAAAKLAVNCSPIELLDQLQQIETELGRQRNVAWGPRTLDLDIGLFGDEVIQTDRLTIPHPACFYRRFAIDPLVHIATDVLHPIFKEPLEQLQQRLRCRPLKISIIGDQDHVELKAMVEREFPEITLAVSDHASEPALTLSCSDQSAVSAAQRLISLASIPGSLQEACRAVLTAAVSEPQIRHDLTLSLD